MPNRMSASPLFLKKKERKKEKKRKVFRVAMQPGKTWRTCKSLGMRYFTKKIREKSGISSFYSKSWKSQGI